MGRNKLEMKYEEEPAKRMARYKTRKPGLMKKAAELSILTGAKVLLLIQSDEEDEVQGKTQGDRDQRRKIHCLTSINGLDLQSRISELGLQGELKIYSLEEAANLPTNPNNNNDDIPPNYHQNHYEGTSATQPTYVSPPCTATRHLNSNSNSFDYQRTWQDDVASAFAHDFVPTSSEPQGGFGVIPDTQYTADAVRVHNDSQSVPANQFDSVQQYRDMAHRQRVQNGFQNQHAIQTQEGLQCASANEFDSVQQPPEMAHIQNPQNVFQNQTPSQTQDGLQSALANRYDGVQQHGEMVHSQIVENQLQDQALIQTQDSLQNAPANEFVDVQQNGATGQPQFQQNRFQNQIPVAHFPVSNYINYGYGNTFSIPGGGYGSNPSYVNNRNGIQEQPWMNNLPQSSSTHGPRQNFGTHGQGHPLQNGFQGYCNTFSIPGGCHGSNPSYVNNQNGFQEQPCMTNLPQRYSTHGAPQNFGMDRQGHHLQHGFQGHAQRANVHPFMAESNMSPNYADYHHRTRNHKNSRLS